MQVHRVKGSRWWMLDQLVSGSSHGLYARGRAFGPSF